MTKISSIELENLFRFQKLISEMQETCISISNPEIRIKAGERIDELIKIYKTFDKYYYSAHFNQQKVLYLQNELQETRNVLLEKVDELEKLKAAIEWTNQQ